MARFDVYRVAPGGSRLVVDVQASILSDLATRVVVPLGLLETQRREPLPRLRPLIAVLGETYILQTMEIAPLPAAALRTPVANIEAEHRDDIARALDFLFQGF